MYTFQLNRTMNKSKLGFYIFFRSFINRIAGYQSAGTVKNLTETKVLDLEESIRAFPTLLAEYVTAHKIKVTSDDQLHIFKCFNDGAMLNPTENFEGFAFRNGDKLILLQIADYINTNIKCSSFVEHCYPNATQPKVSTIVGNFYGSEQKCSNKYTTAAIEGK